MNPRPQCFMIAFVLAGVGTAAAQDDPSRTFEVRLPVTVTHKKELVTGLTPDTRYRYRLDGRGRGLAGLQLGLTPTSKF